ncbi:MAG: putative leader peptide [Actinoallomurus sp.]
MRPMIASVDAPTDTRVSLWVIPQVVGVSPSRRARWHFTPSERPLTIVSVRSWTEMLTKRRAVDFCRVATALCRTA